MKSALAGTTVAVAACVVALAAGSAQGGTGGGPTPTGHPPSSRTAGKPPGLVAQTAGVVCIVKHAGN